MADNEHPLEQTFNLPAIEEDHLPAVEQTVTVEHPDYDEKDTEVESQIDNVYDLAVDAFRQQQESAEMVDPKYSARNMEVAAQFLNTALSAAKEKSDLKQHKDKINLQKKRTEGPSTVNNNLVVGDRNEILKALMKGKEDKDQ